MLGDNPLSARCRSRCACTTTQQCDTYSRNELIFLSRNIVSCPLRPIGGVAALVIVMSVSACSNPPQAQPDSSTASGTTQAMPSTGDEALGERVMVRRDGHDLAFYLTPGAGGTIVLDAGGGNDASYWNAVVTDLAAATGAAIVTYDRTGAGMSDDVPGAFDPSAAGEDLASGLTSLDLPDGPVVLAAHSIAGEVAHALVNKYPDSVDSAVLIDANLPPFFTPEETARLIAANQEEVAALETAPATRKTQQLLAAAENWGPVHTAFHAMTWPQEIPVAVIVSDRTPMPAGSEDASNWRAAAQTFAEQAPNRHLVTAIGSSHDVALDDLALVEKEIESMYEATQA